MIRKFEDWLPILRELGNLRLPYVIFAEAGHFSPEKVCMELSCKRTVIDMSNQTIEGEQAINDSIDYILGRLRSVASHDDVMVIVAPRHLLFKSNVLDAEPTKLLPLVNELHTHCKTMCDYFKHQEQDDYADTFVYVKAYIDNTDIAAFASKSISGLPTEGFEAWQPWHTVLLHKPTRTVAQVIWDTREIVGYGEVSEQMASAILAGQNSDDNCSLLFDKTCKVDEMSPFAPYVIDQVEVQ